MSIYLVTLFSYLSLIISEILPFCSWLDANGILHGLLLLCQGLWLLCCGSEKSEPTRQESVWLRQPRQEGAKQYSPYHRSREAYTVTEPWQSTLPLNSPVPPYPSPSGAEAV
jgi:hypothetical protein